MQTSRFSFITRGDTLLGACAALGEDFGFNPLYLRMAFATLLLWNPVVILSAYFGLFAVILASRVIFPSAQSGAEPVAAAPKPLTSDNDAAAELQLAA